MTRFVSICLALLLFLPGQVCASALCLHGKGEMPCHQHGQKSRLPVLQQDCAKNDLQGVTPFSIEKPAVFTAPFPIEAIAPLTGGQPDDITFPARGPPDGARLKPPPLLVTLRFRP